MIRSGVRRLFHLALRRRDRWEREVEDEIKLHLTLRAEQLMHGGQGREQAYAEAVRRFGPLSESRARLIEAARHREQHMQRTEYLSDLRTDLTFALRTLRRDKGWTAVTVLTLALGIGATTAVFSVVSSLLLHPLPYPQADRLVLVDQQPNQGNHTGISVSITPPTTVVSAWRKAHSFEVLEGYRFGSRTLATTGDPVRASAVAITPGFVALAGSRPLIGRSFQDSDATSGTKSVVLGEAFWRTRFGADRSIVGKSIRLSDTSYTVLGVLPQSLRHPRLGSAPADVWLPIDMRDRRQGMSLIGRLRPGISRATAAAELDSLFARGNPLGTKRLPFLSRVESPGSRVSFRDSLILLTAAVSLVLIVACTNVAHLQVARSGTREREFAVRAALGAGRVRLFRQLLTESALLAAVGCVLGVVLGWAGLKVLLALRPEALSELAVARLDQTTLIVAVLVAGASSLVFGIIGSLQWRRASTHDALKTGAVNTSSSRRRANGRALMIVTETALSGALVVGATMLIRSVSHLQQADLGFVAKDLYAVPLNIPKSRYPTPAASAALVSSLEARLNALRGVSAVSAASAGPGERNFLVGQLEIEGEPAPPPSTEMGFIDANDVRPNYFATMGAKIVEGSTFTDTSAAAHQVIVNAGFARKHFTGSALGHRLRVTYAGDDPWSTIVGVASDIASSGATTESSSPVVYSPMRDGRLDNSTALLVRTDGAPASAAGIRSVLRTADPMLIAPVSSVSETLAGALAGPRFVMLVLSAFSGLALLLAGIGIYGLMTHLVTQRTREIGIRIALGATPDRIALPILRHALGLAALGAAIGLGVASWGSKLIEHELFGITRSDRLSFAVSVVVLLCGGLIACILPTLRALAVDPMTAIRAD